MAGIGNVADFLKKALLTRNSSVYANRFGFQDARKLHVVSCSVGCAPVLGLVLIARVDPTDVTIVAAINHVQTLFTFVTEDQHGGSCQFHLHNGLTYRQ